MNTRGKKLNTAIERVERAQAAMEKVLLKMFPIGTTVRFRIQYGQVNPSIGTVIAHEGGPYAYVRIRLRSGSGQVRSVSARNIL
jgi:hypothetical protein